MILEIATAMIVITASIGVLKPNNTIAPAIGVVYLLHLLLVH